MSVAVSRRRRRVKFWGAVLIVTGLVAFATVVLGLPRFDRDHLVSIDCEVVSTKAVSASSASRMAASSRRAVLIESSDCPSFLLYDSVTSENADQVAAAISRGPSRIEIGQGSKTLLPLFTWLNLRATVYHVSPLPS